MRNSVLERVNSLQELLIRAAKYDCTHGIGYIDSKGNSDFISYSDFLIKAKKGAAVLRKSGINAGDIALIVLQDNKDIIDVFWACIFSGVVPSILQAPMSFDLDNQSMAKIKNVFDLIGDPHIIFDRDISCFEPYSMGDNVFSIDHFKKALTGETNTIQEAVDEDAIAYIQFSSGSTGKPKGVVLSNRNITSNLEAIAIGLHFTPHSTSVNWMPLYHDMGLIGYHLSIMHNCSAQFHINTIDFVRNPFLWLDAISEFKAVITGSPNFGLVLTNRFLKKRQHNPNWNFVTLKAMLNGAEPISPKVMYEFNELLASYNFSPKAMMPVYGMAEASLAISFTDYFSERNVYYFSRNSIVNDAIAKIVDPDHPDAMEIVAVGKALKNIEFRIVDFEDKLEEDLHIGHIQIRGNSVTNGYYYQMDNEGVFTDDGWLRTGDMGFNYDGELFISGRFKDLIIFGGRNLYAHDFEYVSQGLDELQYGKVVFCGYFDDVAALDRVVCFIAGVAPSKRDELSKRLRDLIMKHMGVSIHDIIWLKPIQIPKTSSGKLQRYKLLNSYLKGEFVNN